MSRCSVGDFHSGITTLFMKIFCKISLVKISVMLKSYVAHLMFSFVRLSHCSCQTMTDMSMHLISCQLCPFSVGNKCLEIFSSMFVGWFNIVDGVYFSAILQPIGRNPSSSDCDRVEFYQTLRPIPSRPSSLPGSPV